MRCWKSPLCHQKAGLQWILQKSLTLTNSYCIDREYAVYVSSDCVLANGRRTIADNYNNIFHWVLAACWDRLRLKQGVIKNVLRGPVCEQNVKKRRWTCGVHNVHGFTCPACQKFFKSTCWAKIAKHLHMSMHVCLFDYKNHLIWEYICYIVLYY